MTEAEWRTSAALEPMRVALSANPDVTDRKVRLFLCACCRRVWHLLDEPGRAAIEVAERYADGRATNWARQAARRRLSEWNPVGRPLALTDARQAALDATERRARRRVYSRSAAAAVANLARANGDGDLGIYAESLRAEEAAQADLLRCIFGPNLGPARRSAPPASAAARALAEAIHCRRDFYALPVLADALEEAGCDDAAVLDHCRGAGPHAPGCHAVDWVLGKS